MYFVYFLRSKIKKKWSYVGYTSDLKRRFSEHKTGLNKSTSPYVPLVLDSYIAVESKKKAKALEKYFKTGSGKAILNKRILSDEASA